MNKKLGISLLEVMLSLSIIAIILILALRYFDVALQEQKVTEANRMIQSTRSAASNWLVSHDDYKGMSLAALQQRDLLPKNFNNPWGEVVTIEGDTSGTFFTVKFYEMPYSACLNLAELFNPASDSSIVESKCLAHTDKNSTEYVISLKN